MRVSRFSFTQWAEVALIGIIGFTTAGCYTYSYGPGGWNYKQYNTTGEVIRGGTFCGYVYVDGKKAEGRAKFELKYSVAGVRARPVIRTKTLVGGYACFPVSFPRPAALKELEGDGFEVKLGDLAGNGYIEGHDLDEKIIFARFDLSEKSAAKPRDPKDPIGLKALIARKAAFGLLNIFSVNEVPAGVQVNDRRIARPATSDDTGWPGKETGAREGRPASAKRADI